LRSCADCAAELENIQAPIALFRGAVREWSAEERTNLVAEQIKRNAADVARVPHRASHHSPLWVRFATAGAALALAIALGIGGSNWRQAGVARVEQERAQEDEALLGNIQAQVMRPVPATMQPVYNLMAQGGVQGSVKDEGAK
jgi:hypothetical protein